MDKKNLAIVGSICFICSFLGFLYFMGEAESSVQESGPDRLGRMCVAQLYPATMIDAENLEMETAETGEADVPAVKEEKKKTEKKVDNSKPQVIIYHTHSSESYQPYTGSNFHREEEEGTVREVGDVLTEELNKQGISVYHDKTIHDRPSYNQSYDRSLETITALLRKYPTAVCVIDLHRDAAAYTGNVGETIKINGETVAKYKLVIGQNNDNYRSLIGFANKVNSEAEAMYPGFGGRIIEKEYRYNEYIADNYLLLEVGNNQNDISEVRATGKYFARVLAKVLEDE